MEPEKAGDKHIGGIDVGVVVVILGRDCGRERPLPRSCFGGGFREGGLHALVSGTFDRFSRLVGGVDNNYVRVIICHPT